MDKSKFEPIVKWAKDNVKIVVTVAVLGVAVTLGWAKGCTFGVAPDTLPDTTAASAPAAP